MLPVTQGQDHSDFVFLCVLVAGVNIDRAAAPAAALKTANVRIKRFNKIRLPDHVRIKSISGLIVI